MISSIIERDPSTATTVWHHYDPDTDITTVETLQDTQYIVDANQAKTNMKTSAPVRAGAPHLAPVDWQGIQDGWHHIGRIPATVEAEWLKEGIHIWKWGRCDWTTRKMKQKLNSPEWKKLRIGNAKL